MCNKHQPILVTGAHRSGTTWVGKMLAAGGEVAYISEPLNVLHRPGIFNTSVGNWYSYICEENEAQYLSALKETLQFRYHPWQEIKSLRSPHDLVRMARDWSGFTLARARNLRPLLKDPFAVFSVPWVTHRTHCQAVIIVRHPAAFTSSLKRLDWQFDFRNLLNQPILMQDLLEPYRDDMMITLEQPTDVINSSSLLWRMIYQTVSDYKKEIPSLKIVRHEDMSMAPAVQFKKMYASLNLNFTSKAEAAINKSTASKNPSELSTNAAHATQLDSKSNIRNWKHRLTQDEIKRIQILTEDIAHLYYTEEDWL